MVSFSEKRRFPIDLSIFPWSSITSLILFTQVLRFCSGACLKIFLSSFHVLKALLFIIDLSIPFLRNLLFVWLWDGKTNGHTLSKTKRKHLISWMNVISIRIFDRSPCRRTVINWSQCELIVISMWSKCDLWMISMPLYCVINWSQYVMSISQCDLYMIFHSM